MFIETRFYNNGKAQARLHKICPVLEASDKYDAYIDEYETMEEWLEELEGVELDDIVPLVLDLEIGKWVNISAYY